MRELHRPCEQHHSQSHRSATWTPKSCRLPVVCHQTVANRLRQLPSWACGIAKSMSLTIMLRVTRPPTSRQTQATALSTANPRRPNTPALEHAARWWPKQSKGRPHRHKRNEYVLKRRSECTNHIFLFNVVGMLAGQKCFVLRPPKPLFMSLTVWKVKRKGPKQGKMS